MSTTKDVTLIQDDLGIHLELHWGVTTDRHPMQLPPHLLWRDLVSFSIAGQTVLTHRPEDLLPILCVHGASHGWERLAWLCDVREILRSEPGLDWDRTLERATSAGGRRILFLGLILARDLLGAQLPPRVSAALNGDSALTPLSAQVQGWLAGESLMPLGERERLFIRLREHAADKLLVAFKQAKSNLALTSRDTDSFPLPPALAWMLYPLRPIRLARDYGLAPFRRFLSSVFPS